MKWKNYVLPAFTAIGGWLASALGGFDLALKILLALMGLDYLTGFLLATVWKISPKSKSGLFSSKESVKGLLRKGLMLVVVTVGVALDRFLHVDYVRTTVIIFYIANEGLSLLENTALMGVPYPDFVKSMLEVMQDRSNKGEKKEDAE